ncbi:hypothetical protein TNCV_2864841 [Trichonephila clavipes]|nr:hypothetical protein TNCV_2864841 [Trichonephila clavipes]
MADGKHAECMGEPQAPTPQRCSAGCLVYRQCALEGWGSEIQYNPELLYWVQDQCGQCITQYSSAASHHSVIKLESDHRDIAVKSRICQ